MPPLRAFAYQPDLRSGLISTVVPNQGPVSGGTEVDLGQQFPTGLKVVFGAVIITDPEITTGDGGAGQSIRSPLQRGNFPVQLTSLWSTPTGTATASEGYTYTELLCPWRYRPLRPAKGRAFCNIPAQITGSGFLTGARVPGCLEAVAVTVLDASTIARCQRSQQDRATRRWMWWWWNPDGGAPA